MSRQDAGSGFHVLSSTGINNDVTLLKVDYDPPGEETEVVRRGRGNQIVSHAYPKVEPR